MPRKPNPNATEYLRRVLGIPTNRPITGHESQRLDFAAAVLELIIKDPPARKQMGEIVKSYARDNGMLPKVCYAILKTLKDQTVVRYDDFNKVYHYNDNRYKEDLKAIRAFQRQICVWKYDT